MKSDISDLASEIAYEFSKTAHEYQEKLETLTRNYLNELGLLAWKTDKEVTVNPDEYIPRVKYEKFKLSSNSTHCKKDGKFYKIIRKITPTVDTDIIMLGWKAELFLNELSDVIQELRSQCEGVPHFAPHLIFKIDGFMCSATLSCGVLEEFEVKNDAPVS